MTVPRAYRKGSRWMLPPERKKEPTGVVDPCDTCGAAYEECEDALASGDYTTDSNGNHDGLCCEDCWHPHVDTQPEDEDQ